MTKTIPIWTAVVNRAVARKRAEAAARLAASGRAATEEPQPSVRHQSQRDDVASHNEPTLSVGPSALRSMQQNGGGFSCTELSPPFHSPWAACAATDYDTSGACARVGSLSQWLQSPVAAAAGADDSESYPAFPYSTPFSRSFPPQTPLQFPSGGIVGSSNAAFPTAVDLSGCRAAGVAPASGSCEGVVDPRNSCDTDLSGMEIFGEVSFGDISDTSEAVLPHRDRCQLQTSMVCCQHEKPVPDADGARCGSAQSSDSSAGTAVVMKLAKAAPAECSAAPGVIAPFVAACPASAALPATSEVVEVPPSMTEIEIEVPVLSALDGAVDIQAAVAEVAEAPSEADVVVELSAGMADVAAQPVGNDVVELPAVSTPAGGGGGSTEAALPPALVDSIECTDSVDLGAASASHVSCSPEECWRWGCMFAGVVDDGNLRSHCGCDTWECPTGGHIDNSELNHICKLNRSSNHDVLDSKTIQMHTGGRTQVKVEEKAQAQSHIEEEVHVKQTGLSPSPPQRQRCPLPQHKQQRPLPSYQRQQTLQHESDLDADGSAGSCSDTCGPTGLSGLASTRSTSSSSSSLSTSRSSSCSSCHSDGAPGAGARVASGAGSRTVRACLDVQPSIPRCRPFPRNHTCSASSAPHWLAGKARWCGSLPPRPSAVSCGGGANGGRLGSSGGGSSCSSHSTCSASCSAPSSNACSHASSSNSSRNSSVGGGGAADVGTSGRDGADADDGDGWDVGLHLPLWVSSNERAQIERRLDGWVDALLRVGADVEGLSKVLRKPLRPLWISQSSTIWVDQVAQPDQLPFTPLYLVSASQPHSYLRQAGGVGGAGSDADGDNSDGCHAGASAAQHHRNKQNQNEQQPHAWTYVYVPGAGDDEESWAAGLTPPVFWAHYTELLQAGPTGVHKSVRQILQREANALAERGTNSGILAEAVMATSTPLCTAPTDQHHLLPAGCRGGGGALLPRPGGQFFIGPTGFALGDLASGAAPGCWEQVDAVLSCGIHEHPSMVGEPRWQYGGLAEGLEAVVEAESDTMEEHGVAAAAVAAAAAIGVAAGARPGQPHARDIAAHATDVEGANAGAAIGQAPLEGIVSGPPELATVETSRCEVVEEPERKAEGIPGEFSFLPPSLGCVDGPAPPDQAARCLTVRSKGGGNDTAHDPLGGVAVVGQRKQQQRSHRHHHHHRHHHNHQHDQDQHHHARHHRPTPRYLHLPVQHFKHSRTSLIQHLDAALGFLSYHLSRGRRVLIHDTNGSDTCVCIAVALLLACYGPCYTGGPSAPAWKRPYCTSDEVGISRGRELVPRGITKDAVRQCLAYVSEFYPNARPTRGMLRQVFNHFVRAQGGGHGEDAAGAVKEGVE
ncbi:hypothetical protein VaNZ11_015206 [Volvox africanus]|uniref:Tyrosine specific protein phosphatases domain-containing protein n=1 Tax=Volvox africanus TaxID=51714 RepID=A0ABQ5SKG5_9CHLO|nr:hypothetical protein VaNZ11_015206 [Volvox africanus]